MQSKHGTLASTYPVLTTQSSEIFLGITESKNGQVWPSPSYYIFHNISNVFKQIVYPSIPVGSQFQITEKVSDTQDQSGPANANGLKAEN